MVNSNNEDSFDGNNKVPHWLDRVIRLANARQLYGTKRPSQETIVAYLLGEASELQRQEMIGAMADSDEFRAEILEMAEDLDRIGTNKLEEKIVSTEVVDVPDFTPQFRKKTINKSAVINIGRIFVPLAAAALLVFAFRVPLGLVPTFNIPSNFTAEARIQERQLELAYLIPVNTRSSQTTQLSSYPSAEEAALAAFRSLVEYDRDDHAFRQAVANFGKRGREIVLRMTSDTWTAEQRISLGLGEAPKGDEGSYSIYVLTMPERTLYVIDHIADTITVNLGSKADARGCAAIVQGGDTTFLPVSASVFGEEWR